MALKWYTLDRGIRYYEHAEDTIPDPEDRRRRRPKRNFYLQYKWQGKVINEVVGWEDEYPEAEVRAIALELARNRKEGHPPFTNAERRQANNQEYQRQQAEESRKRLNTFDSFFYAVFMKDKKRRLAEGDLSERYVKDLEAQYGHHLKNRIGLKTFDEITKDDFNDISIAMFSPKDRARTDKVENIKRDRDYEAEDARTAQGLKFKRIYRLDSNVKPLSKRTVQFTRGLASEVWKMAQAEGLTQKAFPGAHIAAGGLDNARTRYLTPDEVEGILDALKQRADAEAGRKTEQADKNKAYDVYHYTVIASFSGLRAGSIFSLTWGALRDGVARDTKNKTSLPIPVFKAVQRLQDVIAAREAMFPKAKRKDFVFPKKDGGKMTYVTKTFKKVVDDLRLNADLDDERGKVVFHTLRHSYASWLVQKGLSLEKVADLLGHKSLQMTNRYKHFSESHIAEAADILNGL